MKDGKIYRDPFGDCRNISNYIHQRSKEINKNYPYIKITESVEKKIIRAIDKTVNSIDKNGVVENYCLDFLSIIFCKEIRMLVILFIDCKGRKYWKLLKPSLAF